MSSQHYTLELKDTSLDKSIKFDSCKKISLFLTTYRRDRWKLLIQKKSFHLHSMFSFNENPLSKSYLLRQHNPICNALFKFANKNRTNLLGTLTICLTPTALLVQNRTNNPFKVLHIY